MTYPSNLHRALGAALALCLATAATAQLGIGFQAGYLNSNASAKQVSGGSVDEDIKSVNGYVLGAVAEIAIGEVLAIQPEVNLLRSGYGIALTGDDELNFFFNVIEVPLLFKGGYVSERFSLAGVAGPSFQYTASAKLKGETSGVSLEEKIDFDDPLFEDINRTNFFGVVGVQLGVPIGVGKFVVDGRYRFQLNDADANEDFEIRGRGISATAGIIFTFGDY